MRSHLDVLYVDWDAVGRRTLVHIPQPEQSAFIDWISDDPKILRIYTATRGEGVIPLWAASLERKQMNDQRLPEGF